VYNPGRFKSYDKKEAFELMDQNPFATVINVAEGKPMVSQLPLTPTRDGDSIVLIGHMARANPQWRSLTSSQVTVLFQGPHTYITPKWYVETDVPTWNYSSVQVEGQAELLENHDTIVECLRHLTAHVERHWPSGWEFSIPRDLAGDSLAKSIVAFRIRIEELHFKKKLSQNRSAEDRAGVMMGLGNRGDDNSRLVLGAMRRHDTSVK
jgi:transcriptional regulator